MAHEIETPSRTSRRVTRRRATAAAVGVSALLAAFGIAQLQGASAEPVNSDIAAACVLGTSSIDVTVPLTVDDKVDPVPEGGQSILETSTGLPSLPVEVTINKLVVTTPIPTQIASTDAVTFGPGNVTPSYEVIGSDLVVTFTGPVSSSQIQVPSVTAEQTVAAGSGATAIDWKPFSKIDADTNYGVATCTPGDPNQIVNSTTITAGTTEPTTPPTTEPTEPTTPPTTEPTEPTTPPTTEPTEPTTPPTTSPRPAPAPPLVPGVPLPPLPVPVPAPPAPVPALPVPVPAIPAPPSVPTPAPPSLPTLPPPGQPCPGTGLPPLPVIGCPAPPAPPAPDIDVDGDIDVDLTIGIGF